MEVKQIYQLVNTITNEVLGSSIVKEDLSNVVDVGNSIFNANKVDNYVKSLVNHIGRVIFVDRAYNGSVPSVLMDSWEFGSVLEKISCDLPTATENESWDLQNGQTYNPNVFYKPSVSVKFYNSKTTFEIPLSFTEMQVKESFSNAEQLNGFLTMLYNSVEKSITIKIDSLIMRTINNMIGETLHNDMPNGYYGNFSTIKAVNLLKLYNDSHSTPISASNCLDNPDFIRYATYIMSVYGERITKISSLFNIGGKDRFTPKDVLKCVMLADFKKASEVFLKSDLYNEQYATLPESDTVPYWQGSGNKYGFNDITKIHINLGSDKDVEIETSGIIGVMFDRDCLGVSNLNRRVTTNYNPKAEFYTNFYKFDAGFFNDLNENFVVFFVKDANAGEIATVTTTNKPVGSTVKALIDGVESEIDNSTTIPYGTVATIYIYCDTAETYKPVVTVGGTSKTVSDYDSVNKRYSCQINNVNGNLVVTAGQS